LTILFANAGVTCELSVIPRFNSSCPTPRVCVVRRHRSRWSSWNSHHAVSSSSTVSRVGRLTWSDDPKSHQRVRQHSGRTWYCRSHSTELSTLGERHAGAVRRMGDALRRRSGARLHLERSAVMIIRSDARSGVPVPCATLKEWRTNVNLGLRRDRNSL